MPRASPQPSGTPSGRLTLTLTLTLTLAPTPTPSLTLTLTLTLTRHAKREAVALVKQRDDEIAELIIKMERMQRAINQVL